MRIANNPSIDNLKSGKKQLMAITVIIFFAMIAAKLSLNERGKIDCANQNCKQLIETSVLSDQNNLLFANDLFNSELGKYYRLVFRAKSDKDTKIIVRATNAFDEEILLGRLDLEGEKRGFKEIIFKANQNHTDILFEKLVQDGAKVTLDRYKISKLNIETDDEAHKLNRTIFGEERNTETYNLEEGNDFEHKQLMNPNIIFGQIFKSPGTFISEAELDVGVVKEDHENQDKYEFVFKEVEVDKYSPKVKGGEISRTRLSATEIESLRQSNGKVKFPVQSRVERNKYYFVGLNNDRIKNNKHNYLTIRGSEKSFGEAPEGAVVKEKGKTYLVPGDLYLKLYGLEFKEHKGKRMLLGSTIEDLGKGITIFKYQPSGDIFDMADIESHSKDVYFDKKIATIMGEATSEEMNEANFVYKLETVNTYDEISVLADQAILNNGNTLMQYSLNGKKWFDVEKEETDDQIVFSRTIIPSATTQDTFYLKIFPEINEQLFGKNKIRYGIKNLIVRANLNED